MLVNNVYFDGKKGAAPEFGEMREIGVFVQKRTELLSGGLR